MAEPALPRWKGSSAGLRLAVSVGAGLVAGTIVLLISSYPKAAGLAAWIAGAATFLLWTHLATWWLDARSTAALAQREDPSGPFSDAVLIVVALVTLLVVVLVIFQANPDEPHYVVFGVISIALAWLIVHTVFTLRYARLYYANPVGGIDFNHDAQPDYRDFYYLGFTVGMTFQVSDTDISKKVIRTSILRHALISFVFGTMIIAVTINILAGLGGK